MLRSFLTRYRLFALLIFVLGGWAVLKDRYDLAGALLFLLLVAVALGAVFPRLQFYGPFQCRLATTRRQVVLTFDDGPDPASTPPLLDVLKEAGVRATFFGVGHRVDEFPKLAARIVREGHRLENHSYSHLHRTNIMTVKRLRTEMERTQAAIQRATGVVPTLFRPPMGLSNPRVFRAARALGLTVVGWSARGLDTVRKDPERIVKRIVRQLKPGAIILLHDGCIPADRLLRTVKTLLDTLETLGYEVVPLESLPS